MRAVLREILVLIRRSDFEWKGIGPIFIEGIIKGWNQHFISASASYSFGFSCSDNFFVTIVFYSTFLAIPLRLDRNPILSPFSSLGLFSLHISATLSFFMYSEVASLIYTLQSLPPEFCAAAASHVLHCLFI